MNKMYKSRFLGALLLGLCAQAAYGRENSDEGVWAALARFIFGESQQRSEQQIPLQKDGEQAPCGVTIDDYIEQLRSDLNGARHYHAYPVVSEREFKGIEYLMRAELRGVNLQDSNYVNQIIRTVLISDHEQRTDAALASSRYIDVQKRKEMVFSEGRNMAVRLEAMPYINGEALAQFYGKSFDDMIIQRINNVLYGNNISQEQAEASQYASDKYTLLQPVPSATSSQKYKKEYVSDATECPVCCADFDNGRNNQGVSKVILKPANKAKQCGHTVCHTCIASWTAQRDTCPMCRETIDMTDLKQKLNRH